MCIYNIYIYIYISQNDMHGRWYSMSQINKDNDPHTMTILHSAFVTPPKKETLESWKVYGKHHRTTILVPHVSASFWGLLCRKPYFSDRKHDGFLVFPIWNFPCIPIEVISRCHHNMLGNPRNPTDDTWTTRYSPGDPARALSASPEGCNPKNIYPQEGLAHWNHHPWVPVPEFTRV